MINLVPNFMATQEARAKPAGLYGYHMSKQVTIHRSLAPPPHELPKQIIVIIWGSTASPLRLAHPDGRGGCERDRVDGEE